MIPSAETLGAQLDALGPFVSADVHSGRRPLDGPWLPLAAMLDRGVFRRRVARVGGALTERAPAGTRVGGRVATSTTHLGLVARLVAVTIAVRTISPERPAIDWTTTQWQDTLGGPIPLAILEPTTDPEPLIPTPVERLTELAASSVGDHVAWGNVASGVNSAARLIATSCPGRAETAHQVADEILGDPRIEGGTLHSGPGFRRRSCCLIYRLAGTPTAACGDCILTHD